MPALAEIQRDFCHFVRGHGHQDFSRHMKTTAIPKEVSLRVYNNNIFSTHIKSLKNDYPLVFSIMGSSASLMARAYVEVNLPCTGSLEDWGGGFAAFIQRYPGAAAYVDLADIARYEWAKHLAYLAEESCLPTPEEMKIWTALNQDELTFRFQESCQLMAFSHPLEAIISTHQEGRNPLHPENQGSSYALILKHQGIIKVYWLTPSLFAFLNRLKEGQDTEVAFAAAQVLDPHFDVQDAFVFLLSHPILHR